MKKNLFTLLLFYCLFQGTLSAQTSNSNAGKVSLFFEKVYLNTDRDLYATGEDIWFKVYLVNARNNYLTNNSTNLYVDLVSSDNEVIDREVIPMEDGIGNGDFHLKDSLPEGTYYLRAYTKWMLNFGDLFVYSRAIQVHSVMSLKPNVQGEKTSLQASLRFMPEGGSLVDSVESLVGFKATDENGKSCKVKGAIVTSTGDTITWFEDQYLGMGQFQLMPEPGITYFAAGVLNGAPFKIALPKSLPKGYVLSVSKVDTLFLVRVLTNTLTLVENAPNELILQGQNLGKSCYGSRFKVTKTKTALGVPQSAFLPGVTIFTLYETQPATRPFCERLVYLEGRGQRKASVTITTHQSVFGTRDSVRLHIKTSNQLNQPVKANVSVAVVDAELIPASQHSIASYLYLESELKTKLENAAAYFDPANTKRGYTLDLLMLTQGWRDFLWKQLADTLPKLKVKYLMERGFYVSGRVRELLRDQPVSDANVTLFITGAKKNGLQLYKTDSTGKFFFDLGAEFYGSRPMSVTSKKFNKISGFVRYAGEVLIDSIWMDAPQVTYRIPFRPEIVDDRFAAEANSKNELIRKYKLSDTIQLNEMMVKATNTKAQEQMGMFLINGASPDMDIKITDEDASYSDIGMFLLDRIPQAQLTATTEGQRVRIKGITGSMIKPRFILDGRESADTSLIEEEVYNLMMDQIDRVLISKQDLLNGDIDRYVIGIYTKPGSRVKGNLSALSIHVRGYYEARVFYSPNYQLENTIRPDLRTTIFWAPKVETDSKGEATLRYFNADKKVPVRITVEGISNTGVPVAGTARYEVK